jgi:D-arabinose 1-dehydrogenase-like Zn-dependent alcohol dehydrogenase
MAKAAKVLQKGGPLTLTDFEPAEPGPGQVRLRVHACGVCHSDAYTVFGGWPGLTLPRAPGHEIAGVVDRVGPGVERWKEGDRAGVGWFGGIDFSCDSCRRGDFITCEKLAVPGLNFDGGYSEYVIVQAFALARLPEALTFEEAAPLLCAGITTFNALRHSGALPGDTVAIQGIGGLGHLGVQYAAKMGFRTIAIARGADKEPFARELGAAEYIDSAKGNPGVSLRRLGGARVILSTVTDAEAMASVLPGLGRDGRLVVVGASMDPMSIPGAGLIGGRKSVAGWPSGTSIESEDTLNFSALTGVRARIEPVPIAQAQAAFEKMMSGAARFRMVVTHN